MSYQQLEQERKNILKKYCCRLHIVNPEDAKRVCEIEDSLAIMRQKQLVVSEPTRSEK